LQDCNQCIDIKVMQRSDHRQTTDEFWNQTKFEKVFRLALFEQLANLTLIRIGDMGTKSD